MSIYQYLFKPIGRFRCIKTCGNATRCSDFTRCAIKSHRAHPAGFEPATNGLDFCIYPCISKYMKICTNCKQEKSIEEYYKQSDRKSGASFCKKCFNIYCSDRWKKIKNKALEYKGSKCIDCFISFPQYPSCIFDFHHLDPSKKDMAWNKTRLYNWDRIIIELDKCVLLCSNCHRIRHNNE